MEYNGINMPISHGGSYTLNIPLNKLKQTRVDILAGKDLVIGNTTYKVEKESLYVPMGDNTYRYSIDVNVVIDNIDKTIKEYLL